MCSATLQIRYSRQKFFDMLGLRGPARYEAQDDAVMSRVIDGGGELGSACLRNATAERGVKPKELLVAVCADVRFKTSRFEACGELHGADIGAPDVRKVGEESSSLRRSGSNAASYCTPMRRPFAVMWPARLVR